MFTPLQFVLGHLDVGVHLVVVHEVVKDGREGGVTQHLGLEWTKSGKCIWGCS